MCMCPSCATGLCLRWESAGERVWEERRAEFEGRLEFVFVCECICVCLLCERVCRLCVRVCLSCVRVSYDGNSVADGGNEKTASMRREREREREKAQKGEKSLGRLTSAAAVSVEAHGGAEGPEATVHRRVKGQWGWGRKEERVNAKGERDDPQECVWNALTSSPRNALTIRLLFSSPQ